MSSKTSNDKPITLRTELLTKKEVLSLIPISKSTMYVMINNGTFPRPIKIGERRAFWKLSDIKQWYKNNNIHVYEDDEDDKEMQKNELQRSN